MRKGLIVVLAAVLVAAFALPAMAATVDLSGFIRIKPMLSNTKGNPLGNYTVPKSGTDNNGVKQTQTDAYVDQRARLKFGVGDENVKFVAFFESDNFWGDTAYDVGRNKGGGLMADTVQLETKNMYVWFKIPDTSLDFTVGLQGFSDVYQGAIFNPATDFAGIIGNVKYDPVAFRYGWAKLWESSMSTATDANLYLVEGQFSPTKDAKVGVNLYYIQDGGATQPATLAVAAATANGNFNAIWTPNEIFNGLAAGKHTAHIWIPGVNFVANAGPATLSGFFLYEFGDVKSNGVASVAHPFTKITVSGYAADVRADFAGIIPGKLFVEGVYASGDSNRTDDKYGAVLTGQNIGNVGAATVYRTDMYILGGNGDDITTNAGLANDIGNGGAGMIHFAAGYTFPLTPKLSIKGGLGWLAAAKKRQHDGTLFAGATAAQNYMQYMNFANDTAMGTEANVFLNYNIYKGLDIGIVGAYAWLGNAYKPSAAQIAPAPVGVVVRDPDNLYDVHARLNYAF